MEVAEIPGPRFQAELRVVAELPAHLHAMPAFEQFPAAFVDLGVLPGAQQHAVARVDDVDFQEGLVVLGALFGDVVDLDVGEEGVEHRAARDEALEFAQGQDSHGGFNRYRPQNPETTTASVADCPAAVPCGERREAAKLPEPAPRRQDAARDFFVPCCQPSPAHGANLP